MSASWMACITDNNPKSKHALGTKADMTSASNKGSQHNTSNKHGIAAVERGASGQSFHLLLFIECHNIPALQTVTFS